MPACKPLDADKQDLRSRFRVAMRGTVSGVAVITTDGPAGRAGITVSSMCSLSFEPPSIMACVHKQSRALAAIQSNGVFVANVLSNGQSDLADVFAGRSIPYEDRFLHGNWSLLASGAPALAGATACVDCKLVKVFEFGSHQILVGQVLDLLAPLEPPLIYAGGGFHLSMSLKCQ